MDYDELEQYNTKDPHEMEPNDVAYCPVQDEFVKVDEIQDDGTIKGCKAHGDNEGQDIQITMNDVELAFSPHSFGQIKRFSGKGTGFSKQGRKLKYPRNKVLDSVVDDYHDGDMDTEEFTETVLEKVIMGIEDAVKTAQRAILSILGDEYEPIVNSREMTEALRNTMEQYSQMSEIDDCRSAGKETAENLAQRVRSQGIELDRSERKQIKKWWRNNIDEVWCPTD